VKVIELLEADDALADLEKVMKLRATKSHISQEKAVECLKWLTSQGYRWSFEETTDGIRFLRIVQASIKKQAWRNKPGMAERRLLHTKLGEFGYAVGPFRSNALKQEPGRSYGPHVFFW
jgi:hypothetical protein